MTKTLLASAAALALLANQGHAAMMGSPAADVKLLQAPACAELVLPTKTGGASYVNLKGAGTTLFGPYGDPFKQWPALRNVSPFNVLFGFHGANAIAFYDFDTPQTSVKFVWGSPDMHQQQIVGVTAAGTKAFVVTSEQFTKRFPPYKPPFSSYNVEVTSTVPFVELRLVTNVTTFEYANVTPGSETQDACD